MSTSFPSAVDTLLNPTSADSLGSATAGLKHGTQHTNANDAIEAIEAWGYDSADYTTFTLGTLSQSSAVSKTTNWAVYRRFGKMVHVEFQVTITGTGTVSNLVTLALPSPLVFPNYGTRMLVGIGYYYDNGTAEYPMAIAPFSTTSIFFYTQTTGAALGTSLAVGLAANDTLQGTFVARVS